ncbi:uncharacterized protein LOC142225402 [Haematobia irritans]|uniref:uncharacterized protein LOC142225402 n=1 Tax=Haematobia irritans TaxID=7368 RepID=UPI003F50357A
MPETVPKDFDKFNSTLSLDDPLGDYENLVNKKLKIDAVMPNEMMYTVWDKISQGAREALWNMMFGFVHTTNDELDKAAVFLKVFKDDSCFYSASAYNDWIVKVRDELLERRMFDFWKNVIVEKELGPAWARDSDLFEDSGDEEPAQFYNYAGCIAPWKKNK